MLSSVTRTGRWGDPGEAALRLAPTLCCLPRPESPAGGEPAAAVAQLPDGRKAAFFPCGFCLICSFGDNFKKDGRFLIPSEQEGEIPHWQGLVRSGNVGPLVQVPRVSGPQGSSGAGRQRGPWASAGSGGLHAPQSSRHPQSSRPVFQDVTQPLARHLHV